MALLQTLLEEQRRFDAHDAQRFFAEHTAVPAVAIGAYLLIVVWAGPPFMKHRPPMPLRRFSRVWNAGVALFSMAGAAATVPHLVRQLLGHGFKYTVCADCYELAGHGAPAAWAALFAWSKFFELVDTLLLVLKKRPLLRLHWFHHASVIAFTWVSWVFEMPLALWYGSMNFSVHAVMYSYFFAASIDRRVLRLARLVTTMQLAQFAWGTVLNLYATTVDCPGVHPTILRIAAAMYLAYGALFLDLFVRKYIAPRREGGRAGGEHRSSLEDVHSPLHGAARTHVGEDAALKAV